MTNCLLRTNHLANIQLISTYIKATEAEDILGHDMGETDICYGVKSSNVNTYIALLFKAAMLLL